MASKDRAAVSSRCGTVFQVAASGRHEKILYRFRGTSYGDGDTPTSNLIVDASGRNYGTTYTGGSDSVLDGTVFALVPGKGGYTERILYRFPGYTNDGVTPYGGLAIDQSGALYGATAYGGTNFQGTIF